MLVDHHGFLNDINVYKSPNANERPAGVEIDTVVIHCISLPEGEFGNKLPHKLFLNQFPFDDYPALQELRDLRVSSHLIIERTGAICQYVPFTDQACHAGISLLSHRTHCNEFSIGIELEGAIDIDYTSPQYDQLALVLLALFNAYPTLSLGSLVGHNEVAPSRKTDPGPRFDWQGLYKRLIQS